MARIYDGIWKSGKSQDLNPGHHYQQQYRQGVHGIEVPQGEMVTIFENPDRSGKRYYTFYQGMYHHLFFHGRVPTKPGCIRIEKTDLTKSDMVELISLKEFQRGKFYSTNQMLPVGDWRAPKYFPNDTIDILNIPYGLCVEVFRDTDSDKSFVFDGIDEGKTTRIKLSDYRLGNAVSRIKVTADGWRSAGIHLENEKFIDGGEWEAETIHISDNSEIADISGEVKIIGTVEESKEIAWDIRAGVSAKAEFQFGPETAQGTVGVEVSVEGGYGENERKTSSRTVEHTANVSIEGGIGNADLTLMVRRGIMEADIVRMWINERTGATTETRGHIRVEKAGETRIAVR